MRHLYVVTHAESEHHLAGVVGGWNDSDLSGRGRLHALDVARAVRDLVPDLAGARVYTSDLRRAVQTAEPVATALGVEVDKRPGLREISYGDAEGRPQRWLDERFVPAPTTSAGRLDHRFGLPDAETKREFGTRVYATLQSILREDCQHQVVVTHGFALTFVVAAWLRIPLPHAAWAHFQATSGGLTHLREDDRYVNRSVVFINRTSHLSDV